MYLILALIFFLLFKLLDTELSYKQSFSLILHCYIPHLIKAILAVVIAMVKGSYGMMELQNLVASNPGALVDPKTQKVLHTLLTSLDLFNVWVVVLMILGFGIVSDKKPSRVAPWIIGLWILWIVVKVGATAVLGSVFEIGRASCRERV